MNYLSSCGFVQKYGGTSVGSVEKIRAIAKRVKAQVEAGQHRTAIVVSAMAGETNRFVETIHQVNPNAPAKAYDMAVAAGEQVSVALLAAALEKEGISAEPFLAYQLGIQTDPNHKRARIQSIRAEKIYEAWENKRVPVVAGFQGVTNEMALTTLGRGGSDISAVALAVALKAEFCEINTDVDGVYSADPRVVKEAALIERLDYDTALELAAMGGKVLHSRCVEIGAKYRMPIVVRNSFSEKEDRRTEIMTFTDQEAIEAPVVSAVSLDRDVVKITVDHLPFDEASVSQVFERLADKAVNVDIIVYNKIASDESMHLGFSVTGEDRENALDVLRELQKESNFSKIAVSHREDLAKVSVVGLGMKSYAGVASRAFSALHASKVELVMVSTSEIKVSCVVPIGEAEKACQALHRAFFS